MDDDQLDLVFGALADRTRRAILARLADQDMSVGALTALFTMSQPAVSKHLRVLEQAGLVSRSKQGTVRLSRLEAAPMEGANGWLEQYRALWSGRYARLDALLDQLDDPPPTTIRGERS